MVKYDEALKQSTEYFNGDELAAQVFLGKYALTTPDGDILEPTPKEMHHRLAKEFHRIEQKYPNPLSYDEIFELLDGFSKVVPQGSPMFGIGNDYYIQSLGNCFVLPAPLDSYGSIMKTDEQLVQLAKRRCGIGFDISNIRPKGMPTKNSAKTTDGIGVFMERFSNSTREVAQCIAKGQNVLTETGLKPIEEVAPGKDKVWTKQGWVKVLDVLNNGKKQVQKVKTVYGYEIETTNNHIFAASKNGDVKEVRLKDLFAGDKLTVLPGSNKRNEKLVSLTNNNPYQKKSTGNKSWLKSYSLPKQLDEKLAYFIGYSYGDGYVNKDKFNEPDHIGLATSNSYPDIKSLLRKNIADVYGYEMPIKNGDGGCEVLSLGSKVIMKHLQENRLLKQKSAAIKMPKAIINSPASVQNAFIGGYFDADGYASGRKKGYAFASISKPFLRSVQDILLANGIVSKIHKEDRSALKWHNLYTLVVVGSSSQESFINQLAPFSVKVASKRFISKRDCMKTPFLAKTLGVKVNQHNFLEGTNTLSVSAYNKIQEQYKLPEVLVEDEIKSIEASRNVETYDLVLEKEHLFWCNGFYVHNSGRRGALLLSVSIHHPEIETFINIKKDKKKVTGANVSIKLTQEFIDAVQNDEEYEQRWPVDSSNPKVKQTVKAKKLWDQIVENNWEGAEPGIFIWPNVEKYSPADCYGSKNKHFKTESSNPCGEILMGSDSCRLLLLNTVSYVQNAFKKNAKFDTEQFAKDVQKAQRLMDDLIDLELESIDRILAKIESDPEPNHIKQTEYEMWEMFRSNCEQGRRTGLGVTGIGDTVASLGLIYGDKASIETVEEIYKTLALNSYRSSVQLAKERKPFPMYEYELEKDNLFINQIMDLDKNLKADWKKYGRRNVAITTTAPAGSVSMLTQTTSGIEPAFLVAYTRRRKINPNDPQSRVDFVDDLGDKWMEYKVYHHGFKKWMEVNGKTENDIQESPYWGATSNDVDWVSSVELQAAAQKWICHSLSKTINVPKHTTKETVNKIYRKALETRCKGITIYRDGSRSGVLVSESTKNNTDKIADVHAPKRPKELDCDIYHITVKGEKWNVFVGLYENRPYEIFAGLSKFVKIPKRYKKGKIVKYNGGSNARYDLHFGDDLEEDPTVLSDISSVFENSTEAAFTRLVSTALRHGTPVQYMVEQLQKGAEKDSDLFAPSKGILRILKNYVEDGLKSKAKCPECGNEEMAYQEGCLQCTACSYSKCG